MGGLLQPLGLRIHRNPLDLRLEQHLRMGIQNAGKLLPHHLRLWRSNQKLWLSTALRQRLRRSRELYRLEWAAPVLALHAVCSWSDHSQIYLHRRSVDGNSLGQHPGSPRACRSAIHRLSCPSVFDPLTTEMQGEVKLFFQWPTQGYHDLCGHPDRGDELLDLSLGRPCDGPLLHLPSDRHHGLGADRMEIVQRHPGTGDAACCVFRCIFEKI